MAPLAVSATVSRDSSVVTSWSTLPALIAMSTNARLEPARLATMESETLAPNAAHWIVKALEFSDGLPGPYQ